MSSLPLDQTPPSAAPAAADVGATAAAAGHSSDLGERAETYATGPLRASPLSTESSRSRPQHASATQSPKSLTRAAAVPAAAPLQLESSSRRAAATVAAHRPSALTHSSPSPMLSPTSPSTVSSSRASPILTETKPRAGRACGTSGTARDGSCGHDNSCAARHRIFTDAALQSIHRLLAAAGMELEHAALQRALQEGQAEVLADPACDYSQQTPLMSPQPLTRSGGARAAQPAASGMAGGLHGGGRRLRQQHQQQPASGTSSPLNPIVGNAGGAGEDTGDGGALCGLPLREGTPRQRSAAACLQSSSASSFLHAAESTQAVLLPASVVAATRDGAVSPETCASADLPESSVDPEDFPPLTHDAFPVTWTYDQSFHAVAAGSEEAPDFIVSFENATERPNAPLALQPQQHLYGDLRDIVTAEPPLWLDGMLVDPVSGDFLFAGAAFMEEARVLKVTPVSSGAAGSVEAAESSAAEPSTVFGGSPLLSPGDRQDTGDTADSHASVCLSGRSERRDRQGLVAGNGKSTNSSAVSSQLHSTLSHTGPALSRHLLLLREYLTVSKVNEGFIVQTFSLLNPATTANVMPSRYQTISSQQARSLVLQSLPGCFTRVFRLAGVVRRTPSPTPPRADIPADAHSTGTVVGVGSRTATSVASAISSPMSPRAPPGADAGPLAPDDADGCQPYGGVNGGASAASPPTAGSALSRSPVGATASTLRVSIAEGLQPNDGREAARLSPVCTIRDAPPLSRGESWSKKVRRGVRRETIGREAMLSETNPGLYEWALAQDPVELRAPTDNIRAFLQYANSGFALRMGCRRVLEAARCVQRFFHACLARKHRALACMLRHWRKLELDARVQLQHYQPPPSAVERVELVATQVLQKRMLTSREYKVDLIRSLWQHRREDYKKYMEQKHMDAYVQGCRDTGRPATAEGWAAAEAPDHLHGLPNDKYRRGQRRSNSFARFSSFSTAQHESATTAPPTPLDAEARSSWAGTADGLRSATPQAERRSREADDLHARFGWYIPPEELLRDSHHRLLASLQSSVLTMAEVQHEVKRAAREAQAGATGEATAASRSAAAETSMGKHR